MNKIGKILIMAALTIVMALPAAAQPQVKAAFESLRKQATKTRTSTQVDDKGLKQTLDEIYFDLADDSQITKFTDACEADSKLSYTYITHEPSDNREPYLIYNDDNTRVVIGNNSNYHYVLYCMADPDNEQLRYCYSAEWFTNKKGRVEGRVVKTYGPRPGRKSSNKAGTYTFNLSGLDQLGDLGDRINDAVNSSLDNYIYVDSDDNSISSRKLTEEKFLTKFNYYRNCFKDAASKSDNSVLVSSYATKLMTLSRKVQGLNLSDNMLKACVKSLQELKSLTHDEFVQGILDDAIAQYRDK